MKKLLFLLLAGLVLSGSCSKNDDGENTPEPKPDPTPEVTPEPDPLIWDGTTVTQPADLNATTKTATIKRASDLAWLSEQSNADAENTFEGWVFTLTEDLDLNDKKWTPISHYTNDHKRIFKGTFDGGPHLIKGLYVDDPQQINVGLFGLIQGAVIKNLHVSGTVRGKWAGGICGNVQESSRIEKCSFSGKIEGQKVGGICGWIEGSSELSQCHCRATVVYGGENETLYIGGIAGVASTNKLDCSILSCSFIGKFEKGSDFNSTVLLGGIIGKTNRSKVGGCMNTADIEVEGPGTIYLGGIVGLAGNNVGAIAACYNTGAITNRSQTNGYTGGIAGDIENNNIIDACYNIGRITPAPNETAAGKVNQEITRKAMTANTIMDCYYAADQPEVADKLWRFSASRWPLQKENSGWNIGNDPETGKFWKHFGTPGTTNYPKLWWEE